MESSLIKREIEEINKGYSSNELSQRAENSDNFEFISCDSMKLEPKTAFKEESLDVFVCDAELCEEMFTTEQRLSIHKMIHSNENYCDLCHRTFKNKNNFSQHINKHLNTKTLICIYCNKSFTGNHKLTLHLKVHTNERPYKCDKTFKQKSARNKHLNVHSKLKKYLCQICNKEFSAAYSLKQHILFIHENIKTFPCTLCPRKFPCSKGLTEHKKYHESKEPPKINLPEIQSLIKESLGDDNEEKFKCETCALEFDNEFVLQIHMEIHDTRIKCELCGKFFSQDMLKPHLDKIHQKDYCNLCEKEFFNKIEFRRHQKEHDGYECCICFHCKRKFARKSSLIRHLKEKHTNEEKSFPCGTCGKTFFTSYQLKVHTITHNTDREFTCKVCNYAFKRRRHLINHMVTHAISTPFSCDLCQKTFKTSLRLKEHKIIHTKEKAFKCTQCSSTFKKSSYLKFHLVETHKTEKDASCEVCNKLFKRASSLQYHMYHVHNPQKQLQKLKKKQRKNLIAISPINSESFECLKCNERCPTLDVFNHHRMQCFKEDEIICEMCHSHFGNDGAFEQHPCIQNLKCEEGDARIKASDNFRDTNTVFIKSEPDVENE